MYADSDICSLDHFLANFRSSRSSSKVVNEVDVEKSICEEDSLVFDICPQVIPVDISDIPHRHRDTRLGRTAET